MKSLLKFRINFFINQAIPDLGSLSPMSSQNNVGRCITILTFPFDGGGRLKSTFKYLQIHYHIYSASSSLLAPNLIYHIFHPF